MTCRKMRMFDFNLLASLDSGIDIRGYMRLGLLAPLALSISIIYKTIHCRRIRDIPVASLVLCVSILAGMMSIGVGLLLIYKLMA